jgi:pseudoazurin
MNYTKTVLIFLTFIFVLPAYSSQAEEALKKRIAPVGSVCMAGEDCSSSVAAAMPMASTPAVVMEKIELSQGSEHVVKMLNSGAGGTMIFEPAVIKVSKGDTIHFKAVDMSHNSASMEGMIPYGAKNWLGQLSKDISVTLDTEGVYVYQCDPHVMMAMIGVIQVGKAVNLDSVMQAVENQKSKFIMNSDRLNSYLSQL